MTFEPFPKIKRLSRVMFKNPGRRPAQGSSVVSQGLIILVTLVYVGVAISEIAKGNYPMATIFAGYSIANLGFIVGVR